MPCENLKIHRKESRSHKKLKIDWNGERVTLGRYVGRFISSSYKRYKKKIFTIVIELGKTIKKSMATGIAQKSCTALFPLWSQGKMIY